MNELAPKILAIKNMFSTGFPHEGIDFKFEFFDYLESVEDEEILDILIKLMKTFHLVKNEEQKSLIHELEGRLRKQGINFSFNREN